MKAISIKVTKLTDNPNNYRTPLKELDYMINEPEVGKSLELYSRTAVSMGIRISTIQTITPIKNGWIVETINSKYQIERLGSYY